MKCLPTRTALPRAPLSRRHAPSTTDYTDYRACLRLEFGFTCTLCLLHEQDLIDGGVEGTGLFWIEHHELQSKVKSKKNVYGNCLLACRFCNNGRNKMPASDPKTGATLLDPTQHAWADRFYFNGHTLTVLDPTDADATYSWSAYHLGDARKGALRETRERRFNEFRRAEADFVDLVPQLVAKARESDGDDARALLRAARSLEQNLDNASEEVARYTAVPEDAPRACRCDAEPSLPSWLDEQTQQVEFTNRRAVASF